MGVDLISFGQWHAESWAILGASSGIRRVHFVFNSVLTETHVSCFFFFTLFCGISSFPPPEQHPSRIFNTSEFNWHINKRAWFSIEILKLNILKITTELAAHLQHKTISLRQVLVGLPSPGLSSIELSKGNAWVLVNASPVTVLVLFAWFTSGPTTPEHI